MRLRRIGSYLAGVLGLAAFAGVASLGCWLLESLWPAVIVLLPLAGALLAVALRGRLRGATRVSGLGAIVPGAVSAGAAFGALAALHGMEASLLRADPNLGDPEGYNEPALVAWAALIGSLGAMCISVPGAAGHWWRAVQWYAWTCPLVAYVALFVGVGSEDFVYDAATHSFVGLPARMLLQGVTMSAVLLVVAAWRGRRAARRDPLPQTGT